MSAPSAPVKRVVKRRVASVVAPVEQVAEPAEQVDTSGSIIPSSRIHTYVSGFKLNKDVDDKIKAVKEAGADVFALLSVDEADAVRQQVYANNAVNVEIQSKVESVRSGGELSALLDEDQQRKVGDLLKRREERNAKLAEAGEPTVTIDIKEVACEVLAKKLVTPATAAVNVLSKQRAKFSKTSFDVLSAFGDFMVEELTNVAMANLLDNKKNTVTPAFVFCDAVKQCKLFEFYKKLPAFVEAEADAAKPKPKAKRKQAPDADVPAVAEPVPEVVEEEAPVADEPVCKVNFDFYIKAICNKVKEANERFADVKVSERYQKFCSKLILDMLDLVAITSNIVLNVMDTKTITTKLFKTCLHLQTFQCPEAEAVLDEVCSRVKKTQIH